MITDQDRIVISQQIRIARERLKSGSNREQVERDLFLFLYQHGFKQGVFHEVIVDAFVKGTCKRVQSGEQINRFERGFE